MLSFNPLQLLTLVLMLSLCMANPVNRSADKEDELVINKDLTRTNKSEVPDTGKEKTEESQKKASWETAKYIFISWSWCNFLSKEGEAIRPHLVCCPWHLWRWLVLPLRHQVNCSSIMMRMQKQKWQWQNLLCWINGPNADGDLDENGHCINNQNYKIIDSAPLISWLVWWSWWSADLERFSVAAVDAVLKNSRASRSQISLLCKVCCMFGDGFRTWSGCWLDFSSLAGGSLTGSGGEWS